MAGKRKLAHVNGAAPGGDAKKAFSGVKRHKAGASAHANFTKKEAPSGSKHAPKERARPAPQKSVKVVIQANSNWLALKANIQKKEQKYGEKKHDLDVHAHKKKAKEMKQEKRKQQRTAEWIDNSQILAMDCEMVGVGLSGKTSVLARCSIVDYEGNVVYDKHVRPVEKVTGNEDMSDSLSLSRSGIKTVGC